MTESLRQSESERGTAQRQLDVLRSMDIEGRARLTFELSDNLRLIVESGIRHRHPDYTQQQVERAALRLAIGDELFRKAFGGYEVSA